MIEIVHLTGGIEKRPRRKNSRIKGSADYLTPVIDIIGFTAGATWESTQVARLTARGTGMHGQIV